MTSVEEFFNKRFGESIASMNESEMRDILKELSETSFWVAILKYQRMRRSVAIGSLCTIDPIQNPTLTARTQGALSGLSDLEEMVYRLSVPPPESSGAEGD